MLIKNNLQLEIAKQEAESANRAKSDFLAKMSHELRTPLNSIVGFSDLLISSEYSIPQKQYLETVNKSAKTLLVLVNDILDFSKIEDGKIALEKEVINLIDLGNHRHKMVLSHVRNKLCRLCHLYLKSLQQLVLQNIQYEIPWRCNI